MAAEVESITDEIVEIQDMVETIQRKLSAAVAKH